MNKPLFLSTLTALSIALSTANLLRADGITRIDSRCTATTQPTGGSSFASASASGSSSSNGITTVHTQTSSAGAKATAETTVTVNGKTQTTHSESHDGLPENVTTGTSTQPDTNSMKDAAEKMRQQIQNSDLPDNMKQQMLKSLNDLPKQ